MRKKQTILKLNEVRLLIKQINNLKRKAIPDVIAISKAEAKYNSICSTLEDFIESIEDEDVKSIIIAYYFNGFSWTDIGDGIYLHRTTCEKKIKRYLKELR